MGAQLLFRLIVSAFTLLFMGTVVVKLDGKVALSWYLTFLPLWIFDGFVSVLVVLSCLVTVLRGRGGRAFGSLFPAEVFTVVVYCVVFIPFVIFHVFLSMKLDGDTDLPWVVILFPMAFLLLLGSLFTAYQKNDFGPQMKKREMEKRETMRMQHQAVEFEGDVRPSEERVDSASCGDHSMSDLTSSPNRVLHSRTVQRIRVKRRRVRYRMSLSGTPDQMMSVLKSNKDSDSDEANDSPEMHDESSVFPDSDSQDTDLSPQSIELD